MTEIEQQTQGVGVGQNSTRVAPFLDKFLAVGRGRKVGLKSIRGVVVEAQVSRGELFFENRHASEERERSPLYATRRPQPNLRLTLEKCTGSPSANIFCKGESAVLEVDVKVWTVDRSLSNAVNAVRIEFDGAQSCVEGGGGLRTLRTGTDWLGKGSCSGSSSDSGQACQPSDYAARTRDPTASERGVGHLCPVRICPV